MKILASPYRETETYNPVPSVLYKEMKRLGAEVSQFTAKRLVFESWDIWHLHWPEHALGFAGWLPLKLLKFWVKLKIARAKGMKIFWTAHNLRPHERRHPLIEWIFWRIFLPNVHGIICMTKSGQEQLHREHPSTRGRPVFIIPHGHYRGVYPDCISKDEARQKLGVPARETVVCFVGQIRGYKGIPQLIQCFNAAELPASRLLVAGEPHGEDLVREICEAASGRQNVSLHLQFVHAQELQLYLRGADLIALPYSDILNSGSALLALSFDRPILVPDRGALGELYEVAGPNWVRLYDGKLTPQVLWEAVLWAKDRQPSDGRSPPLEQLNWDRIAALTMAAFTNL